MAGSVAVIPKFQFSDESGRPLSNGTLKTYLSNTTTPSATYQDKNLATPNPTTITLDAAGECVLWLDPAIIYKFVLADSLGAERWTQNDVSGATSAALLAAPDGVTLVGGAEQIVADVAALRTIPVTTTRSIKTRGHTVVGVGAGVFNGITGAAPGTYPDNNGSVIVPTGGDGSAAWLLNEAPSVRNIKDYPTLKSAIDALPSDGGIVYVPIGRWPAGGWSYDSDYMSKSNVSIIGEKMPDFSSSCDSLVGGSVIYGRFNVFADNFSHENIGYDCGKIYMDAENPSKDSHSADHPNGETWDAFAFAQPNTGSPLAPRRGYTAKNIRCLLRDSLSYGHALLQEGFEGGTIDNAVGMYGIHAHVIKAKNVSCGFIAGYGASSDHVILKSDSYAVGSEIGIDDVRTDSAPPGTTPWSTPAACTYGLLLNPATNNMSGIKISRMTLRGATQLFAATGGAGKVLDNMHIGQAEIDGIGSTNPIAINFNTVEFYRQSIGTLTISNTLDGIAFSNTADSYGSAPMAIGFINFSNISLRCVQAIGYARFAIDKLRTNGSIGTLYAIDDTARVSVGKEILAAPPAIKFSNTPPALDATWQQYPGNSTFAVILEDYGVKLQGLLQPVSGGSGVVCSLPPYLRPTESRRLPALASGSGGVKTLTLGAALGFGSLALNDGLSASGAETWLSLDGIGWQVD